jgi:arginine decarboxylase
MITNSEQNMNAIYLPKYNKENHCTSGFLIQVLIRKHWIADGGYHCLIPQPKHILIEMKMGL